MSKSPKQPPEPESREVGGVLKRVHELGTATETLFNRLYEGLNHRSRLREVEQQLSQTTAKANQIQKANRRLRDMLQEKDTEVQQLRHILESIDEGIVMQDLEGRMVMINQAARTLLGNQKNFWDSELGTMFHYQRETTPGNSSEIVPLGEPRQVQVNQRVLSVQLAAMMDRRETRIGTLMILRDITRDTMADRLKNSFVKHVSHEFKTPMNVMRLASEMLLGQDEDAPPNRRMLHLLGKNIDILNRMVEELIEVSEMSGGSFEIERKPVAIEALLNRLYHDFEPEMENSNVVVTMYVRDGEHLHVLGDEARLYKALEHLIRNGVYYNEPGGEVVIMAGLDTTRRRSQVVIKVLDDGVGIAEKDLPHIFDLFYRGEPRTRAGKRLDPRGLGQGLYIARGVAQAHEGYLYAESEMGKGSLFTMTLPAAPEALPQN